MSITFDPLIPLALWLPLSLVLVALLIAYARAGRQRVSGWRGGGMLALMATAAALPLVVLLNPVWVEILPPPAGKPLLTVLIDESASMATADVEAKTRFARAAEIAEHAARSLGDRYDVRLRTFSDHWSAAIPEELKSRAGATGETTDLTAAISEAFEDHPGGHALLLLSDGGHNAGGLSQLRDALDQAKALATPIFTRTLGTNTVVDDIELRVNMPQELAFIHQETAVAVSLRQRGQLTDRVNVALYLDDREVSRQEVRLPPNTTSEATFSIRQDEPGLYRYEIRTEPRAGETTPSNNSATLVLRVVDEPVRVLLLEGKPYWDAKFLMRTLAADESVRLESLVRMKENRYLRRTVSHVAKAAVGTPQEPSKTAAPSPIAAEATTQQTDDFVIESDAGGILADPARLAQYQVVVLGRNAEVFFTDEVVARLRKWLLEENGALVCFRGAPAAHLTRRFDDLIPIRWTQSRDQRFRVQVTESGQSLPWLSRGDASDSLGALPSLASSERADQPKPLAVVLARAAGEGGTHDPVISYQPVGGGKVVVVEGAGMWRWAFLPPEHQAHDQTYRVLWRSLVRWLVSQAELLPSQNLSLRADRVTFDSRESATATLIRRDTNNTSPPTIELHSSQPEKSQSFTAAPEGDVPGQFRVSFGKLPEGRYEAGVAGAEKESGGTTVFDVRSAATERLDVAARPEVMQLIAETSGGAVLEGDDPRQLRERIDRYLHAATPARVLRTSAWDRWWVLLGILALWTGSWSLRRSSGLI